MSSSNIYIVDTQLYAYSSLILTTRASNARNIDIVKLVGLIILVSAGLSILPLILRLLRYGIVPYIKQDIANIPREGRLVKI